MPTEINLQEALYRFFGNGSETVYDNYLASGLTIAALHSSAVVAASGPNDGPIVGYARSDAAAGIVSLSPRLGL